MLFAINKKYNIMISKAIFVGKCFIDCKNIKKYLSNKNIKYESISLILNMFEMDDDIMEFDNNQEVVISNNNL